MGEIAQGSIEEAELEKKRLAWRRMLGCATQMESSLKKCAGDVAKHVSGLAAAAERKKKKDKDKAEKDAEAKHLAKEKENMKKASADGAG